MTIVRVLAVVVWLLAGAVGARAQTPINMGDMFAVDSKVMGEQRRVSCGLRLAMRWTRARIRCSI